MMAPGNLHNDPDAARLWRRCRDDHSLRWLLEGVMSSRRPELGRILLLSPIEFFGQFQARLGPKLSLLFNLTGFPYLSGNLKEISKSLQRMMAGRAVESKQSGNAKKAMADWAAVLGKPFRDEALLAAIRVALDPAGQENA
jgi:hypothetical protein